MKEVPRYVAWGLLTEDDLERLGSGFRMAFPLDTASAFDDLLMLLDGASTERKGTEREAGN
jgi:hypothetical protein